MVTGLEDRTKNFGFILSPVGQQVGKVINLTLDKDFDALYNIMTEESKQAGYRLLDKKTEDIIRSVTQWEPGDALKNEQISVRQFYFVKS